MHKAVFIDMDGTLLKSDHSVSEVNRHAIQKLLNKGVLVVLISARPLHGILPISKGVVTDDMPIVSLNGSYILHKGAIIYEAPIPVAETISVHTALEGYDVSTMYYSRMEWFAEIDNDLIKKEQKITPVEIQILPFNDMLLKWEQQNAGPNKILIAGDKELIKEIEQKLIDLHGKNLNIYKSQATYLEVMSPDASKAKAITLIIDKYGINKNEIIAIGDNYNDKGMIEFAGTGVAMGNAPEEIKLIADYVTDTNNNDGVAKALYAIGGH